jgi:hypothetical protein
VQNQRQLSTFIRHTSRPVPRSLRNAFLARFLHGPVIAISRECTRPNKVLPAASSDAEVEKSPARQLEAASAMSVKAGRSKAVSWASGVGSVARSCGTTEWRRPHAAVSAAASCARSA